MSKYSYQEDLFLDVYNTLSKTNFEPFDRDQNAADNFFDIILNYTNNRALTEKQGRYLQKILLKFKDFAEQSGITYPNDYKNLPWKKNFRVIDDTKSVSVEQDDHENLKIALKMPFSLKEQFEKEIFSKKYEKSFSRWDPDRQVRLLNFYDYNLVHVNEFVERHNFKKDENFEAILSEVEQIWQDVDQIVPSAVIEGNEIVLKNCSQEVVDWFESKKTGDIQKNKFLLYRMNIKIEENPKITIIDKICDSDSTEFWIKNLDRFFDAYETLEGNIAVVLNGNKDIFSWTRNFVKSAENRNLKEKITICFRAEKTEDPDFNQWIKENNLGGKIESDKIFVFRNKPAKWLFSDNIDVNIILTNSIFPVPSNITQTWMNSHHCVMYLGDVKASTLKDKKIVEL